MPPARARAARRPPRGAARQAVPEIARYGNDLFSGRKSTNLVLNDFRPPKFGGRALLKTLARQPAGLAEEGIGGIVPALGAAVCDSSGAARRNFDFTPGGGRLQNLPRIGGRRAGSRHDRAAWLAKCVYCTFGTTPLAPSGTPSPFLRSARPVSLSYCHI